MTNEHGNSIPMMHHYPDLGSVSDWLKVCFNPSSETQGQSVGSGENARRKFSSKGGTAPGYRLSPNYFQNSSGCQLLIGHKKCFVLLCPIGDHISWVLFVCSYTTVIILITACLAHAPKEMHSVRKLSV